MESVTIVLSITGCFRPAYLKWYSLRSICHLYWVWRQTWGIVSIPFLKETCTFSCCFGWYVLCWRSQTTKLIEPTDRLLWNPCKDFHRETICSRKPKQLRTTKQVDSVTAIHSKVDSQVPEGLKDRLLRDPIGADCSFGCSHNWDSHQSLRGSDIVNLKDNSSPLFQSDNLVVF